MKNRFVSILLIVSALLLMLLFPQTTLNGTKQGLLLWYQQFLPAVFPFMILSGLLTVRLKRGGAFFAVCAGFLNGYPTGAKTAADLKKNDLLPEHTAPYYAVFCNMAGPLFLLSFAGLKQELPLIYLTSIAVLILFCHFVRPDKHLNISEQANGSLPLETRKEEPGDYLMECSEIMVKAGIYIMYFSILTRFLSPLSFLPLQLLVPFLELTNGVALIQSPDFPLPSMRRYLLLFLCVTGGLCTAFQTREVTTGLNLSIWRYLFLKGIQAAAVCMVCYLVC